METSRAVTSETIAGSRHLPNSYPNHPPRPNPPPAPRPIVRSKAERSGLTLTNKNFVPPPDPPSPYSSVGHHHYLTDNGGGRQLALQAHGPTTSRHHAKVTNKRSASPDDELSVYSGRVSSRSISPEADLFSNCSEVNKQGLGGDPLMLTTRSHLPRGDQLITTRSHLPRSTGQPHRLSSQAPMSDSRHYRDRSPGQSWSIVHHNGENSRYSDLKDRYYPPHSPVRDKPSSNGHPLYTGHQLQDSGGKGRHHYASSNTEKKFTKTRKKIIKQQSSDFTSDQDISSWDSRHGGLFDTSLGGVSELGGDVIDPGGGGLQSASRPTSTTTNHKDWPSCGGRHNTPAPDHTPARLRPGAGASKSSGASPVDPTSEFNPYMAYTLQQASDYPPACGSTGAIPKKRTRPLADDLPSPNHPDAIVALPLDDNTPTSSVSTSRKYNNHAHS